MFDTSVIKRSGQWWKALAAFWVALLGFASMLVAFTSEELRESVATLLAFGGLGFCWIGIFFGWFGIRCPNCREPWVWRAVRTSNVHRWFLTLLNHSSCPVCEYPDCEADQISTGKR